MGITLKRPARARSTFGLALTLATAGSLALAGCGSSSGSNASATSAAGGSAAAPASATSAAASSTAAPASAKGSASPTSSAAPASTQVLGGGSGKYAGQTLTLWDYETADSALGKARALAVKDFLASHPGAKVKYELKSFEQINSSASLILNSNSAPDVMEYNKGNATSGLLSKQGLLTDLGSQVTKFGWDKLLSPSLQVTAKYDPTGSMGSGKWYGIPTYGEFVFVYYNKDLFAKNNITVPTTLADFESDLAKLKAAGLTPIANGGAEYPTQQIFYELSLSKADRQFVNDFQLYQHKVNFQGPQFTFGATTLQDWVNKGYIAKNTVNLKAQDMGNAFEAQKNPIMISGTWWYGTLASEIKNFKWGTFLFPGNTYNAGSSGNLWVVPSKAKNKDLAYDFINITLGKDVQTLMGNSGGIPVNADLSQITDPGNKQLIADFNTLNTKNGLSYYPDWPAPGYYDVMRASIQDLMNGKSPSSVLSELAKPYDDNLANIGKG
ncbi:MAG: raffinose/stachyose/melibiose transport system substrate-binding protein [Frankiales bacterium]|nr:raffinose/stachyose/melibiose transport system substrate-binding protein [Frankiales bacterium]